MTSVQFSALARLLAQEASRHGLVTPMFKSPPSRPDHVRTIRGVETAKPVVAIRLRGRTSAEVADDIIDGILLSNALIGTAAAGWRLYLRSLVEHQIPAAA